MGPLLGSWNKFQNNRNAYGVPTLLPGIPDGYAGDTKMNKTYSLLSRAYSLTRVHKRKFNTHGKCYGNMVSGVTAGRDKALELTCEEDSQTES